MQNRSCDGCANWQHNHGPFGECRRNAPAVDLLPYTERRDTHQPVAVWPATSAKDWCGQHEPIGVPRASMVPPLPQRARPGETSAQTPAAGGRP